MIARIIAAINMAATNKISFADSGIVKAAPDSAGCSTATA